MPISTDANALTLQVISSAIRCCSIGAERIIMVKRVDSGPWKNDCEDLDLHRRDLIEFDRGHYHHWAMYINRWDDKHDMVVHFNPADSDEKVGAGWTDGIVTVDKLSHVAGNSKVRVNNLIDESPRSWSAIKNIITLLEDRVGCRYSLVTNNCENFVTYLRFPTTSGFRSQKAGGLLSYIAPTWHIGTYDNGQMQTKQWDEYVLAAEENRDPENKFPFWAYM